MVAREAALLLLLLLLAVVLFVEVLEAANGVAAGVAGVAVTVGDRVVSSSAVVSASGASCGNERNL